MSRTASVSFVSGLLLVAMTFVAAPPLTAQDAGATERSHTVRQGETLSGIAEALLGSAALWPRIHELNRDVIPDPHRIAPGTILRLPGDAVVRDIARTEVEGVIGEPETRMPAAPPPDDYRERRALLASRTFQPREAPEPRDEDRTIFHGTPAREVEATAASMVLLVPEEELPVVQPGVARGAGWIIPVGATDGFLGETRSFASGRAIRVEAPAVLIGEETIAHLAPGEELRPGDIVTMTRRPAPVSRVGAVVVPTGEAEVVAIRDGGEAVLRLLNDFGGVQLGQPFLFPPTSDVPVGIRPTETTREFSAEAVAFEDAKEIYMLGDRLFMNRGARDGVKIGDEYVAFSGGSSDSDGATVAARFQVVRVQDEAATLRITRMVEPRAVRVGMRLRLAAVMP